ncbi:MAG: hypothetical protein QGG36_04980 [Pirellulaceae bacterium]|nr:hypothetical protein [Pirellulaceae bacterium]MDP7015127.1 hypothetical protein [Pirellulaceae bacterium]
MTAEATPQKKRRWMLRFGLRAFLLFVAVASVGAGFLLRNVHRVRQEEQALAALIESQGENHFNMLYSNPFDMEADPLPSMFDEGGPAWLRERLGVDLYRTVTFLRIYAPGNSFSYGVVGEGLIDIKATYKTGVSVEDMKLVGRLSQLRYLYLDAHPANDDGVAYLRKLEHLETLHLGQTAITDAAVSTIVQLPALTSLDISRTHVSDAAIEQLSTMTQLQTLNITMTRISEDGLQRLTKALPNCEIEK